jgi:transcriptional regulator with XRE-family HTH domain
VTRGMKKDTELGGTLRRFRRERRITGTELASSIGVTQGTISKIERGLLVPDLDFLSKFAHTLRLAKGDAAALIRLAGVVPDGVTPESVLQYLPVDFLQVDWAERRQETIAMAEAKSMRIGVFNPLLVPGLLQTESYARQVIHAAGARTPSSVERTVQARLRRQRILHSHRKQMTFILTEAALLARIAPAEVLAQQIRHLQEVAASDGVRIGLIPSAESLTVVPPPAFYLLDRRVYIELPHGDLWLLTRSHAYAIYERLFRVLVGHAVTGANLIKKLKGLAERVRTG